jgi:hypothetical protein
VERRNLGKSSIVFSYICLTTKISGEQWRVCWIGSLDEALFLILKNIFPDFRGCQFPDQRRVQASINDSHEATEHPVSS